MSGKAQIFIVSILLVGSLFAIGWFVFGSESEPLLPPVTGDGQGHRPIPPRVDPKPVVTPPVATRPPEVGQRDPAPTDTPPDTAQSGQPTANPDDSPTANPSTGDRSPTIRPSNGGSVGDAEQPTDPTAGTDANPADDLTKPLIEDGLRRARLGADGEGVRVTEQRRSLARRTTGLMPNLPSIQDHPKRLIKGRVVERVGNQLQPLPGVLVTGWRELHRTITDQDGRFEFEVRFADDGPGNFAGTERDQNPNNDYVELSAYSDGYVLTGENVQVNGDPGRRYYNGLVFGPQQVNDPAGVVLEMRWVGEEELKVRFTNPPTDPSTVQIVVESRPVHGAQLDEGFQVSVPADAKGEARFRVPNRRHLEITAIGDNWRSRAPAAFNSQSGFHELTLVEANNMRVTGTTVDVRTGGPAVGVRVQVNFETTAAYSMEDGSFELWVRRDQPSMHMIFDHPSYIRTNSTISTVGSSDPRMALSGAGYAPGGPWRVQMRPAVHLRATIQLAEGGMIEKVQTVSIRSPDGADRVVIAKVENGAVVLDVPSCPWGATGGTMVLPTPDGRAHVMYDLEFQPGTWSASNEVDVRIFATRRQ